MALKSAAKTLQEATQSPPGPAASDPMVRICLRTDLGYEHNMVMAESAVRALLDPDVADVFIEVPAPRDVPGVKHRYLHTSRIKEVDVLDAFDMSATDVAPVKKVG